MNASPDTFLFRITGIFRIKGRGTAIAGLVDSVWRELQAGDAIEIREGEQVVLRTSVTEVSFGHVSPPPQRPDGYPVAVFISADSAPQVKEEQELWRVG